MAVVTTSLSCVLLSVCKIFAIINHHVTKAKMMSLSQEGSHGCIADRVYVAVVECNPYGTRIMIVFLSSFLRE